MEPRLLDVLIDLTAEIALGAAVLAVYVGTARWTVTLGGWRRPLLRGVVFGIAAGLALILPNRAAPDAPISTNAAAVGLGGLFGGWLGGLVALAVSESVRVAFDAPSLPYSLLRTALAALGGMALREVLRRRRGTLSVRHLVVHSLLVEAGSIGTVLLAPGGSGNLTASAVVAPLAIALPLATMLLGMQFLSAGRRVELTRQLTESEARLRAIINNLPGTVYQMRLNEDGKLSYIYASEGVKQSLGITGEEAVADASLVDSAMLPEEEEERQRFLRESMSTMLPGKREFRMRLKDGVHWMRTISTPHRDRDGRVVWTGFTIDITEDKRKDEALRRSAAELAMSERRFRNIVSSAPGVVYQVTLDAGGKAHYRFISEGIKDLIGYTAEEVMADPSLIEAIYQPEDEPERMRSIEESRAHLTQRAREYRGRHRDGTLRWFHSRSVPHREPDGEIVWDGITFDITDRKSLEEELRRSERMLALGALTDGVAHGFNNLFQIVAGYAELLQEDLKDQPKLLNAVDHIMSSIQRGVQLVGELRDFSRQSKSRSGWIDVNPLLADLQDLGDNFVAKGVTLTLRAAPDLWPAAVDASRLQTSILRLIFNAQDAMPQGGEIVLETRNAVLDEDEARRISRPPGPYVEIRVIDSGVGMDDDVLRRATEPFFTTKAVGQGPGLGLSTVHGFAVQAGGHLAISSKPGRGTEVRLLLPAKPPGAADAPSQTVAPVTAAK